MPVVEASVPLLDNGINSARRNPTCTLVEEGAKMEASERVTSKGIVEFPSY